MDYKIKILKIASLICATIFICSNSNAQSLKYSDDAMTDIHTFYAILNSFDDELRDLTRNPTKGPYESNSEFQKRIVNSTGESEELNKFAERLKEFSLMAVLPLNPRDFRYDAEEQYFYINPPRIRNSNDFIELPSSNFYYIADKFYVSEELSDRYSDWLVSSVGIENRLYLGKYFHVSRATAKGVDILQYPYHSIGIDIQLLLNKQTKKIAIVPGAVFLLVKEGNILDYDSLTKNKKSVAFYRFGGNVYHGIDELKDKFPFK